MSALAICGAAVLAPIAASASSAQKVSANCTSANGIKIKNNPLVCQGLAFYRGQTITAIVSGSVGGSADSQARVQFPDVAAFLGVGINPQNQPGSNGVQGMDAIAHAQPTGLTIGTLNLATTLLLQLENQPSVNFNPSRLGWISENLATTNVIIAKANSNCSSIAAMRVASPPCAIAASTTGIAPLQGALLFALLKIPVKWLNIYPSSASVVTGFNRGDAPEMVGNLTSSGGFLQAHVAVTVASALKLPVGTEFRQFVDTAPNFIQLVNGIKNPNKTQQAQITAFKELVSGGNSPLVTQTAVPPYKLAALRAAFDWMSKQSSVAAGMLANAASAEFIDGQQAKVNYLKIQTAMPYFQPLVGPVFGG